MIPAYLLLLLIDDSGLYSGIEVGEVEGAAYYPPRFTIARRNVATLDIERLNVGTLNVARRHVGVLEVER